MAQAGEPQGSLVGLSSCDNPVWATTNEIVTSSGSKIGINHRRGHYDTSIIF
ncbi:hypothetical protein [Arsenophonus sp. PmNCSU2021_1]|uniref:hypothetical protein n=1 Tax=Arsenophonus sp. PmNCSU2021_1 TaxID=3118989 RepID=UPI003FA5370F